MKPNFSDITLETVRKQETAHADDQQVWNTPEGIPVKTHFSKHDIEHAEHLQFAAGLPPFMRGPYSTMYVT
ncbi:MAG TPA: methylmalonyl-CoA mutase family protein, partial [Mariniflexile sp.]|nr:methylmalonyl-CoA mutase family protein [Mariniflexile sp.]